MVAGKNAVTAMNSRTNTAVEGLLPFPIPSENMKGPCPFYRRHYKSSGNFFSMLIKRLDHYYFHPFILSSMGCQLENILIFTLIRQ